METKDYLAYVVKQIHTTIVATVDDEGLPVTAAIDMMDSDDDSLYFLTAFQIYQGTGEWFDLSKRPIERASFTFGGAEKRRKGFYITDACTDCGACAAVCPQDCICQESIPFVIEQNHCLHCGNCLSECPAGAVKKK